VSPAPKKRRAKTPILAARWLFLYHPTSGRISRSQLYETLNAVFLGDVLVKVLERVFALSVHSPGITDAPNARMASRAL